MTGSSRARWASLTLFVLGILACMGAKESFRAGAKENRDPIPDLAPTKTTPSVRSKDESLIPEQVVEILADKTLYPISLETARSRFEKLVELRRESPAPEVILLVGERPDVPRVEVAYSEDGKGGWSFSQVLVLLSAPSSAEVPALFKRVENMLNRKLGKPRFIKRSDGVSARIGWKLTRKIEVWLGEETSRLAGSGVAERRVRIDVAAPGGDPD